MNEHLLPDSRLVDPRGTLMVEWPLPDGTAVRLEVERLYCANCGKFYGYCPRANVTFAFVLCKRCFETYGAIAGTYAVPDDEFDRALAYELERRFGHAATTGEIVRAAAQDRLGPALEALARDSPYPAPGG
jgi:hypothetical protein